MSYIDDLNDAAARAQVAANTAEDATQILFDVANGDSVSTVTTASGEVKTVAKAIADIEAQFGDSLFETTTEQVVLTEGQTSVTLTEATTDSMQLYVEGAREFSFTITGSDSFEISEGFPAGTRLWVVSGEIVSESSVVEEVNEAVDRAEAAAAEAEGLVSGAAKAEFLEVNAGQAGVDRTGLVDVTDSLQSLLSSGIESLVVPSGQYLIDGKLECIGVTLKFMPGAQFVGSGSVFVSSIDAGHYRIFSDSLIVKPYKYTYFGVFGRPTQGRYFGSVKAAWFGAVGDGQYPTDYNVQPVGESATGTDSAPAIAKACEFAQLASLIYSTNNGWAGGVVLEFEPQALYRVDGNNILGRHFQAGEYYAEYPIGTQNTINADTKPNFFIEGNGCIFAWNASDTADQNFIDSTELLSIQRFHNFTIMPCGYTGIRHTIYLNATSGLYNNNSQVSFYNVCLDYGVDQNDSSHGIDRLFNFAGDNLGDRLKVDYCRFRNFKTILRCSNPEAVSQDFTRSSFYSALDSGRWVDLSVHGSNLNFYDCEMLAKGTGITMVYMRASSSPYGLGNVFVTIDRCRIESQDDQSLTLANTNFGKVVFKGIQNTAGGPALSGSELAYAFGSGSVVFEDCAVQGRLVVGEGYDAYSDAQVGAQSASLTYGIFLERTKFYGDISKNVYWRTSDGSASGSINGYASSTDRPRLLPIVIRNSPSYNATEAQIVDKGDMDTGNVVQDNTYFYGGFPATCGSTNRVVGMVSFDGGSTISPSNPNGDAVLRMPAQSIVSSVRVYIADATGVDEIEVEIGGLSGVTLTSNVSSSGYYSFETSILISSLSTSPRNIEVRVKDSSGDSMTVEGFAEVEYRPAPQLLITSDLTTRSL